jgi:hypothetical protein
MRVLRLRAYGGALRMTAILGKLRRFDTGTADSWSLGLRAAFRDDGRFGEIALILI